MSIIVCIPARYASSRFCGKVLACDTGKFLVQHTYEQACLARLPREVIIAADDSRIVQAAAKFGASCILTSLDHQSGTDRIAEAVCDIDVDIVINVQADEPEIDPAHIDLVGQLLIDNPDCPMATLASGMGSQAQVSDPNIVKVIVDSGGRAIYFSRLAIPYDRDSVGVGDSSHYLRHIGIYAYRKSFLAKLTSLPQTMLEQSEKLEQLRVIENGYSILVGKVDSVCEGIDTFDQYQKFVKRQK